MSSGRGGSGGDAPSLFDAARTSTLSRSAPLATRMRPRTLDEVVGQQAVLGPDALLRKAIESDRLASLILWGPPGTGKTTIARIIATTTKAHFVAQSAVTAGVADLRKSVQEARDRLGMHGQRTVLFIDEIHRFNKGQQDAILPHVEDGTVILIGATTENPSFEVNSALLSRSRVMVLKALDDDDILAILRRALADEERGLGRDGITVTDEALEALANLANGDARFALNTLEFASSGVLRLPKEERVVGIGLIGEAAQRRNATYDKSGDDHFDAISALHKTLRGSDPNAALYWLARMLERGDDPLYVVRRLVRFASEDVGLADPQALQLAISAQQAVHFIGMPEGALALAELTVYLALSPKSNAVYKGYKAAVADVEATRNDPVPLHLRNAPTKLMAGLGYGAGYRYAHDYEGGIVGQQNLPDNIAGHIYYQPKERGYEIELAQRIRRIEEIYARTMTAPELKADEPYAGPWAGPDATAETDTPGNDQT
ncbi:MAG TPA: replication-associated recombination protein A [Thermomicrobiales bacterium]|nr:replication-associated recombination protein A [Thermomicrobiales bacterium]